MFNVGDKISIYGGPIEYVVHSLYQDKGVYCQLPTLGNSLGLFFNKDCRLIEAKGPEVYEEWFK